MGEYSQSPTVVRPCAIGDRLSAVADLQLVASEAAPSSFAGLRSNCQGSSYRNRTRARNSFRSREPLCVCGLDQFKRVVRQATNGRWITVL